jgi:hypothetical protein
MKILPCRTSRSWAYYVRRGRIRQPQSDVPLLSGRRWAHPMSRSNRLQSALAELRAQPTIHPAHGPGSVPERYLLHRSNINHRLGHRVSETANVRSADARIPVGGSPTVKDSRGIVVHARAPRHISCGCHPRNSRQETPSGHIDRPRCDRRGFHRGSVAPPARAPLAGALCFCFGVAPALHTKALRRHNETDWGAARIPANSRMSFRHGARVLS